MYYIAPTDEIFDDLKKIALKAWNKIFEYHYTSDEYKKEKLDRFNSMENTSDNFMCILAMFHVNTQNEICGSINYKTKIALLERFKSVDHEVELTHCNLLN